MNDEMIGSLKLELTKYFSSSYTVDDSDITYAIAMSIADNIGSFDDCKKRIRKCEKEKRKHYQYTGYCSSDEIDFVE